jgi:hypothetical protein
VLVQFISLLYSPVEIEGVDSVDGVTNNYPIDEVRKLVQDICIEQAYRQFRDRNSLKDLKIMS